MCNAATTYNLTWQLLISMLQVFHYMSMYVAPLVTWARTFSDIEIEEVTIEYSLYTAGNNCNEVKEALHVEAIDPVQYVQSTVNAKCKQIVAGDCLCFTRLAYHEQLRQNCHRLQVDGKCPQDLQK